MRYQRSGYIVPNKKRLEWGEKFNAAVSRLRTPAERAIVL
jgi:hypothetical protein